MRERHRDIKRRGPGMIAHACPDPTDASRLGLLDRQGGGAPHHQMTQAIVAVDQRHRRAIADKPDIWFGVDAAGAQPAHVKRQPDHAMGVAAPQIGFDHQTCDAVRVGIRQPSGDESARHKCCELTRRNADFLARAFLGPRALIHFQSVPKSVVRRVYGAAPRQIIRSIERMR